MNIFEYLQTHQKTVITATVGGKYLYDKDGARIEYTASVDDIDIQTTRHKKEGLTANLIELHLRIILPDGSTAEEVFPKGSILHLVISQERQRIPIYTLGINDPRSYQRGRTNHSIQFVSYKESDYASQRGRVLIGTPEHFLLQPAVNTTIDTDRNADNPFRLYI